MRFISGTAGKVTDSTQGRIFTIRAKRQWCRVENVNFYESFNVRSNVGGLNKGRSKMRIGWWARNEWRSTTDSTRSLLLTTIFLLIFLVRLPPSPSRNTIVSPQEILLCHPEKYYCTTPEKYYCTTPEKYCCNFSSERKITPCPPHTSIWESILGVTPLLPWRLTNIRPFRCISQRKSGTATFLLLLWQRPFNMN